MHEASTIVQKAAAENANIIFGAVHDESMGDAVKVTVIATGIKSEKWESSPCPRFRRPFAPPSKALRFMRLRRKACPVEETPAQVTSEIKEATSMDKPTFLRRRKEEKK